MTKYKEEAEMYIYKNVSLLRSLTKDLVEQIF